MQISDYPRRHRWSTGKLDPQSSGETRKYIKLLLYLVGENRTVEFCHYEEGERPVEPKDLS